MHYSGRAVRESLGHFIAGKGITASASILLLIALAHELPRADFAVYATLQAAVALTGALSSFGLNQSVLRYLPEMRAANQNTALYRVVWRTTASRAIVTSACFAVCAASLPWTASALGLAHQQPWVYLYLLVGTGKLTSQFLSRAMESLLWPRISQYALAGGAAMKLVMLAALVSSGRLEFPSFVVMEALVEGATLLLLLWGFWSQQRRDPQAASGDPNWVMAHGQRMRRFGLWNYLTTLVTQLATSSPYRLMAPLLFGPDKVAILGFAYGLADLIARLLPARMARLLLRSVIVGRQGTSVPAPDQTIPPLSLSLRISVTLVATVAACTLAAGDTMLETVTAGKYGDASLILAALLGVLLLDLIRMHHDLLASINERVRSSVGANLGLALGLGVAILAAPDLGVFALPLGAVAGQGVALVAYTWKLRGLHSAKLLSPLMLLQAATISGSGLLIAQGAPQAHWLLRTVAAMVCSLLLACLIRSVSLTDLRWLLGGRRGGSPELKP